MYASKGQMLDIYLYDLCCYTTFVSKPAAAVQIAWVAIIGIDSLESWSWGHFSGFWAAIFSDDEAIKRQNLLAR